MLSYAEREARRDAERDIACQMDYEFDLLHDFNCCVTSWEDGPIEFEDEEGCRYRFEEKEWRFVRHLMARLRILTEGALTP